MNDTGHVNDTGNVNDTVRMNDTGHDVDNDPELTETDVETRPQRLWPVIVGLVVLGVLVTALVFVVASFISNAAPTAPEARTVSPDVVQQYVGVVIPDRATVKQSAITEDNGVYTKTAVVVFPAGADDPFGQSGYYEVGDIPTEVLESSPVAITDPHYYTAAGDATFYSALAGTDENGHLVVSFTTTSEQ